MTSCSHPLGQRRIRVLVLGLGNVLLADDGVGPVALAELERDYQVPAEVRLVDGGTLGLALLDELAQAEHVILVDAVATGQRPGTLVRLEGEAVRDAVRDRLSVRFSPWQHVWLEDLLTSQPALTLTEARERVRKLGVGALQLESRRPGRTDARRDRLGEAGGRHRRRQRGVPGPRDCCSGASRRSP